MKALLRVLLTLLLTSCFIETTATAQDRDEAERRVWGFHLRFDYGRLEGLDQISGQGVTKQDDGSEARLTETPDSFNVSGFRAQVRAKGFFVSYDYSGIIWPAEDVKSSASAEPGRNGDLFINVDDRGFNGRIFRGQPTEEEIGFEFGRHTFKAGWSPGFSDDLSVWMPYGYVEKVGLRNPSRFQLTDFPDARSMTEHRVDGYVFGVGVETRFPRLFAIGSRVDFLVQADGRIGYGNYDYEAEQSVFNPPNPERSFSAEDQRSRAVGFAGVDLIFRAKLSDGRSLDFSAGLEVFTLPTIVQPTGQELADGSKNELGFSNPREFRFAIGFRF